MATKGSRKGAKRLMCPLGKVPYATKRDAEAHGVAKPQRCGRCRNWH